MKSSNKEKYLDSFLDVQERQVGSTSLGRVTGHSSSTLMSFGAECRGTFGKESSTGYPLTLNRFRLPDWTC